MCIRDRENGFPRLQQETEALAAEDPLSAPVAVSYTHLDVYKRQVFHAVRQTTGDETHRKASFSVPIRDSFLDAVGFGGAGQLAHQLEGKRDSAAEAVAGGDAAVYDDFLIVDDGTGQLVLKSGVGGGVPAFQQAEAGEDARCV